MIALSILIVCLSALLWQARAQAHETNMRASESRIHGIESRLSVLEKQHAQAYDHAAFEELKSRVEGMRIAQGLRGTR